MRSAIDSQVDREHARRAVAGSMVYFVVCVVVAVSTPYFADHPVALVLAGCLALLVGGLRLFTARRVLSQPAGAISRNAIVFKGATYATFVVWGISAHGRCIGMRENGRRCCSCCAPRHWRVGHRQRWRRSRPCVPLSDYSDRPTVGATLVLGKVRYLGLAGLAALYLIFLLAQTRGTWRAFWESSAATEREKMLGSAERRRAEAERASLAAAVEQTAEEIVITDARGTSILQSRLRAIDRVLAQ